MSTTLFERLIEPQETRASVLTEADMLAFLTESSVASSGITVTETTMINWLLVRAAVRVLAETISTLPLRLYRKGDGRRERVDDHPGALLLRDGPNPEMPWCRYSAAAVVQRALWGNSYSEIVWGGRGPKALWPIGSHRVRIERLRSGEIVYRVAAGDRAQSRRSAADVLPADRMLHIPALTTDGIVGLRPLQALREAVGLGQAAERTAGKYFANDGRPGGYIKHPGRLSDKSLERLLREHARAHVGVDKKWKTMVLEEGMEFKEVNMPLQDLALLGVRRFQVEEIARAFRVPKHLLQDTETSSVRANIEHEGINFVVHSIRPWLVHEEKTKTWSLLTSDERRAGYYYEYSVDALLRGDAKARFETYHMARQAGIMSANEARELENLNPRPGAEHDVLLVPLNMVPAAVAAQGLERGDREDRSYPPQEMRAARYPVLRRRVRESFLPLFQREIGGLVAEEVREIRNRLSQIESRGRRWWMEWLRGWYEVHRGYATAKIAALVASYMAEVAASAMEEVALAAMPDGLDVFASSYAESFGSRHADSGHRQLLTLIEDAQSREQAQAAVTSRLDDWEEGRGEKAAKREATQASGATARWVFAAAGISTVVWDASGRACSICRKMHGRTISITRPFLSPGDIVEPGGDVSALEVKQIIRHPPLHGGCDCGLRAG